MSRPDPRGGGEPGFDAGRLAEHLRAHGLLGAGVLQIERLTGGQSNPSYRLTTGEGRMVLRKKPPGALLASAHAIDREVRVLRALYGSGVPVPEVYLYSDDTSIVGTPFYLMAFLDGRIWMDPALPALPTAERGAVYDEMNRVIAALHRIDVDAVGLGDFGRRGGYFGRQIARWSRQYRQAATEPIAEMEALMDWLPAHLPPDDTTVLVHGDYRLDNLVFHPSAPRAIGLLDWELSTLGHPLADFSYHCLSWHIPPSLWRGVAGLDLRALGIPDEASYLRRYAEATGAHDLRSHWNFCLAYNLFRLAAITQGVARRALDGNAAAADATQTGRLARPLAVLGWQHAQRHAASHR